MINKKKRTHLNKNSFSFQNFLPQSVLTFFIGCGIGFAFYPTLNPSWIASATEKAPIRVCFSPGGQCTNKIIDALKATRSSILIMAYSFTSPQIAQALKEAFQRGVHIKILIDKSQLTQKHSQISFLFHEGIPIIIDSVPGIAHNKVMILDNRYVLSGSFNFTRAAEFRNAENILFIDDVSLAKIYTKTWDERANRGKALH